MKPSAILASARLFAQASALVGAFIAVGSANAADIDGFVSPAFSFAAQIGGTTSIGSIKRFEVQFGRFQKNVEADLSYGTAIDYDDLGAILRLYNHFRFTGDGSATGLSVGSGIGAHYSSTATLKTTEVVVSPFVRGIWDSGIGVGVALEGGLELIPTTTYSGTAAAGLTSKFNKRFFVGASLMLSSRWLE